VTRQLPPLHRPKTLGGVLYFIVVAATLSGLLVALLSSWRRGVTIVGAALLLSALARSLLGEYDAGMLRVRRRWFDVLLLSATGFMLIFLAATIPNQPGQ
jgi:hypothetical protein